MATFTSRLGLRKPAGTDLVTVTTDINGSMDALDTALDRICTSATRPSTAYAGMQAWESDTKNRIVHDGSTPIASGWIHPSIPAVSALANIVKPFSGQLALLTTNNAVYRYNGSAWVLFFAKEITYNPVDVSNVSINAGASATIASQAITDPGWPYRIFVSADFDAQNSSALGYTIVNAQNNSATFGTSVMAATRILSQVAGIKNSGALPFQCDGVTYTGARTIYLVAQANIGNTTAWGNVGSFQVTLKPVLP